MNLDKSPISILLVEPCQDSGQSVANLFSDTMPDYELDLAPSYAAALSMMQRRNYDVCFAPSRIGENNAIDMLKETSGNKWKMPAIIITGSAGSRIDDADATAQTGVHPLIKGLFGGSFLEQHIRFAMERNRVESAVMRAKKEWELIFDAVSDSIAIIDRNYTFQRVNRAMADRLGSKPADLIGRPCHEVMHGLSSPPDFCPMLPMLQDGQEQSAEIFQEDLNSVVLVSVSPFLDDENNLAGGIVVARDITRLKKIEQELREANENLERHVATRTSELVQKAKDLEESNIALKVLLKHWEKDRTEIHESVIHNIQELISPHLDRMERGDRSKEQINACVREIKSVLQNVTSALPRSWSSAGLSAAEMRIAEMVRAGKSNKEIADVLSISDGTVRVHRERIRRKLGLTNRKTNLQIYLRSLQ